MAQVAALTLGLPDTTRIEVVPTTTAQVADTQGTHGSTASGKCGAATQLCCCQLLAKMHGAVGGALVRGLGGDAGDYGTGHAACFDGRVGGDAHGMIACFADGSPATTFFHRPHDPEHHHDTCKVFHHVRALSRFTGRHASPGRRRQRRMRGTPTPSAAVLRQPRSSGSPLA